jgi:hypothetical protein
MIFTVVIAEFRHIACVGLSTLTSGSGFTVTVTLSVAVQSCASVTVKVYSVVSVGEAVGLFTFVADNPVAGVHAYE